MMHSILCQIEAISDYYCRDNVDGGDAAEMSVALRQAAARIDVCLDIRYSKPTEPIRGLLADIGKGGAE